MVPDLSYLNLVLTSLLLLWPTNCPDLACPASRTIEIIPQTIKDSLDFAHAAANDCSKTSKQSFSFFGFWLGFVCGVLAMVCLIGLVYLVYRLLVRPRPASLPARAIASGDFRLAQQAALPSALPVENRPATPADLRALGLARADADA
jgi:hypothetical protein